MICILVLYNVVKVELRIYKRIKELMSITSVFITVLMQLHYANDVVKGQKKIVMLIKVS